MKKGNRAFKKGKLQAGIFSFLLIFCITIPSYSRIDSSVFQIESIDLPVTGPNNVAFASGRYIFIAPSEPSKAISAASELTEYDNNVLYLYDSKKLKNEPDKFSLGNCYYPSLVHYDVETKTVFVKGTEFVLTESGEYKAFAVIKYMQFDLSEDNNKPFLTDGFVFTIRIPGRGDEEGVPVAPDYVLNNQKELLVFSNGSSIFTYKKDDGIVYRVEFIPQKDYDSVNNTITNLSYDSVNNLVTVLVNKKVQTEDLWNRSSELYFYRIAENGTLDLLKRLAPDALPANVSIPDGSDIALGSEGKSLYAYFVGTDGVLYQTNLTDEKDLSGEVTEIASFDELLQAATSEHVSSVSTYYNEETKVFELLKTGYTTYVHRPVNVGSGRIGKVHRPVNLRFEVEGPAVILAQLGKKNKLIQKAFTTEIADQGGIFMFSDQAGQRYVASNQGNVFELNQAQGINDATLNFLGQLGNRLNSVEELAERKVLVAVKSSEFDEEGSAITQSGSLLVAKRREESNFLSFVNWDADRLSANAVLGMGIGSIRRPCNYRFY